MQSNNNGRVRELIQKLDTHFNNGSHAATHALDSQCINNEIIDNLEQYSKLIVKSINELKQEI